VMRIFPGALTALLAAAGCPAAPSDTADQPAYVPAPGGSTAAALTIATVAALLVGI
jgi:hypothetical protein